MVNDISRTGCPSVLFSNHTFDTHITPLVACNLDIILLYGYNQSINLYSPVKFLPLKLVSLDDKQFLRSYQIALYLQVIRGNSVVMIEALEPVSRPIQ